MALKALAKIFTKQEMSLEDLREAGWTLCDIGRGVWFERRDESGNVVDRQYLPNWMASLLAVARQGGQLQAINRQRYALGLPVLDELPVTLR